MASTTADRGCKPLRECEQSIGTVAVISPEQQTALERHLARERTEVLLDEALGETFPASDPIAVTSRKHGSN